MKAFHSSTRFRYRLLRALSAFLFLGQLVWADQQISITGQSVEGELPVTNGDTSANEPHLFFGTVSPNAAISESKRFTITNNGTEALRIALKDLAPSCSSPEFTIKGLGEDSGEAAIFIQSKASLTFRVLLEPTSQFPSGIVTIRSNATNPDDRVFTFPVAGRGNLGSAGVFYRPVSSSDREIPYGDTSPSISEGTYFGSVLLSTPTNETPRNIFVLKNLNSGTGDTLVYRDARIEGVDSGDFVLTNLSEGEIAEGNEIDFEIKFDPDTVGEKNATLTFETNVPGQYTQSFGLRGMGVTAPSVLVEGRIGDGPYGVIEDGAAVDFNNGTAFGEIAVNGTVTRTFRITNNGDGDLTFPGGNPGASGEFEVVGFPEGPVGAGESSDFSLIFKPTFPGEQTEFFAFQTNIPSTPIFNFAISGTGVGPQITLEQQIPTGEYVTITHNSLNRKLLGGLSSNVAVPGEPTITGNFRLTNSGNADLVLSNKSILDEGSEQFAFVGLSNGLTLAGGESEDFSITLDATTVGDTRVKVHLFTNAPPTPFLFGLRAVILEGSEIAFFGRPADGEFTPVVSGSALSSLENGTAFLKLEDGETSVTSTFRFTNVGSNDLLFSLEDLTGRDAAEFEVSPFGSGTLSPGASQDFTITLTPTSPFNRIAQFHLVTNDPLRRDFNFPLLGNVSPPASGLPQTRVSSFSISGKDAEIQFFSEPGVDYRLRYSSSMEDLSWLDVPGVPVINGSSSKQTLQLTDLINPAASKRFYRIEEVSTP